MNNSNGLVENSMNKNQIIIEFRFSTSTDVCSTSTSTLPYCTHNNNDRMQVSAVANTYIVVIATCKLYLFVCLLRTSIYAHIENKSKE